jgi:hypothetical protein
VHYSWLNRFTHACQTCHSYYHCLPLKETNRRVCPSM